jgi:hypothetical protein
MGILKATIDEEITEIDVGICMNPRAMSCSVCIFNDRKWESGKPWCKPDERKAKQLFDIERIKGHAA